jgi:hypothetical protein
LGIVRRLFFGTGRLPEQLRGELRAEGILLLKEELRGSVTYRHYRAPGRRYRIAKNGIYGALAVTDTRILVWANRSKQVDCPRHQPGMNAAAEAPDRLLLAFDAARLAPERSGRVEVRLRLPHADQAVAVIARP